MERLRPAIKSDAAEHFKSSVNNSVVPPQQDEKFDSMGYHRVQENPTNCFVLY